MPEWAQTILAGDWLPPILEPLALVALLRARASGRIVDWVVAGAALGLAVMAKETILLFVPLALIWLVLGHRSAIRQAAAPRGAVLTEI